MNQRSTIGRGFSIFGIAVPRLSPSSHFAKDIHLDLVDVDPITDTQRLTNRIMDVTQTEWFNACLTQGLSPDDPVRVLRSLVMILMAVQASIIDLPRRMTATAGFLVMGLKASRHGYGCIR
jgi:hypothetical protein